MRRGLSASGRGSSTVSTPASAVAETRPASTLNGREMVQENGPATRSGGDSLLRHPGAASAALDSQRVLVNHHLDVLEAHPRNLGGDDDAVLAAPDVDRRELAGNEAGAQRPVHLLLHPAERADGVPPGILRTRPEHGHGPLLFLLSLQTRHRRPVMAAAPFDRTPMT